MDRWYQVRIPADDHKSIRLVLIGVIQKVHGNGHIRAFLFSGDKVTVPSVGTRRHTTPDVLVFELPEKDREFWACIQSAKVCLLIGSSRAIYDRGEIPNELNVVILAKTLAHALDVQPLVRAPLDGAVVEIKPVNVEDAPPTHAKSISTEAQKNRQPCRLPNRQEAGESFRKTIGIIGRLSNDSRYRAKAYFAPNPCFHNHLSRFAPSRGIGLFQSQSVQVRLSTQV